MTDKIVPIYKRGWCEMSTCELGAIAQDCVTLQGDDGTIIICKPCLVNLGNGVGGDELGLAEERIALLEERLDEALSER